MEEIIQFLAGILNREFIRAVFSNPRVKDNVVKAKLRPMEQKGELLFQLESFTKTQAFHKNLTVEETKDELAKLLEEFRQRNLHSGKMKSKTEVMEVSEMLGDQLASMEEVLGPIMDYGLLRERFAALVTDGLRAKRLESEGYETQVLEFIDMEHTPKNILLRAVKKGSPAAKSRKEAEDCERFLKIQPTLGMLLAEQKGDK